MHHYIMQGSQNIGDNFDRFVTNFTQLALMQFRTNRISANAILHNSLLCYRTFPQIVVAMFHIMTSPLHNSSQPADPLVHTTHRLANTISSPRCVSTNLHNTQLQTTPRRWNTTSHNSSSRCHSTSRRANTSSHSSLSCCITQHAVTLLFLCTTFRCAFKQYANTLR